MWVDVFNSNCNHSGFDLKEISKRAIKNFFDFRFGSLIDRRGIFYRFSKGNTRDILFKMVITGFIRDSLMLSRTSIGTGSSHRSAKPVTKLVIFSKER